MASSANSLTGLTRAFRRWAADARVLSPPEVAGASPSETKTLGALGGIAKAIADERVSEWPPEVRAWAEGAPTPPDDLVEAIRQLIGADADPLSGLYEASISSTNRRRLGTVFTPKLLVDYMVEQAANELGRAPSCVIDPGAGVGAFTLSAARRWPETRIVAVDINVVTLGLLAARLAFEADDPERADDVARIELMHQDYLDALPTIFDDSPGPVLALGNPPYTRVQELPAEMREKAAELSGGILETGHANLAIVFQATTLARMREADVSCMVLPGSLSYTRASRGLRRSLWKSSRAVSVSRTRATTRAFTGRSVQAAVLLIGAERETQEPMEFARVEIADGLISTVEQWEQSRSDPEPDAWFWTTDPTAQSQPGQAVSLADIAVVRRGIATGANDFFFLTDQEASAMPKEVVVAAVPSLRAFTGETLDEQAHKGLGGDAARRWLLSVPSDYLPSGALAEHIQEHESEIKKRHLPSRRELWYSITDRYRPQVLIAPLTKFKFKVVLNEFNAIPSNNLFGISMRNGESPVPLAEWLRSDEGQEELRRISRRYHGGSFKLEPGSLSALTLPVDHFRVASLKLDL